VPINEMARQLGRHRSTIYREIRRNTFHDRQLPEYSGYFGTIADELTRERRRRLRKLPTSEGDISSSGPEITSRASARSRADRAIGPGVDISKGATRPNRLCPR
jgi:IS30 family transposase